MVMYKTRNTGTGNRMQRTQGKGKCYIPGNIAKHFGECLQTFRRMLLYLLGNVAKHSRECREAFRTNINRTNINPIISSSRSSPTKSYHHFSPTLIPSPKQVQGIHKPGLFQSGYFQSSHHKGDF